MLSKMKELSLPLVVVSAWVALSFHYIGSIAGMYHPPVQEGVCHQVERTPLFSSETETETSPFLIGR